MKSGGTLSAEPFLISAKTHNRPLRDENAQTATCQRIRIDKGLWQDKFKYA
jgi:hypothetical protein